MELCRKHLPASHRPVHDICVLPGRTPGHRYGTPHKPRRGWTRRGWRLCQGHGHEPPAQPCAPWLGLSQLLIRCCRVLAASCQMGPFPSPPYLARGMVPGGPPATGSGLCQNHPLPSLGHTPLLKTSFDPSNFHAGSQLLLCDNPWKTAPPTKPQKHTSYA